MLFWKKKYKLTEEFIRTASLSVLENLRQELIDLKRGQPLSLGKLGKTWLETVDFKKQPITREDPLYGYLSIDEKIAPIFLQPIVQRLNYVRQLSFSYFLQPTAMHSRLSHSLGVYKNAEEAINVIFDRGYVYVKDRESPERIDSSKKDECILVAKIAALLHDIGHCAFSHAMDRYTGFKKGIYQHPDKYLSVEYIKKYLSNTPST